MSLNVFLSHSGERFVVGVDHVPTLDAFKQWIADQSGVPVGRQILMTAQGKNVKQQHLVSSANIFVYDKQFLAGNDGSATRRNEQAPAQDVGEPPSELDDETSLASWQKLFKSRRAWAIQAVDTVRSLADNTVQLSEACENIERSANVALDNLKTHVSGLQDLFEKTQTWADETAQEHMSMLREWGEMSTRLKELPIRDDVAHLMLHPDDSTSPEIAGTMFTLLNPKSLDQADRTLRASSDVFQTQVQRLADNVNQLNQSSREAYALVQIEWPNMETQSLLEEAETLFKKVDSDYNDVLRATNDTKAISRISRVAAMHTNTFLPELQEIAAETTRTLYVAREQNQKLTKICLQVLRQISKIQSSLSGLQTQIAGLALTEEGQESLEALDRVFRLPSVYGSILIEAVRRSEWNDKTLADLKNIRDELSQHKDDELRRRKKWTTAMSGFLTQETVAVTDVSDFTFSTPANPWPFVSREEIFTYIDDLRALELNDAVEQITQNLRELESPAKSRRSKPKPFKNGSIHDAMQNSFVRGENEDVRALQDDKSRLEDKLRASESRIRKLEDLLHRQSQMSRPQSGLFTPIAEYERQPSSPGPDSGRPVDPSSRRSSVSARRSSNQPPDEKAMVQRILSLEAEVSKLREEAHAERRSSDQHREKMQEAESVKRDLMANFDSQRQEFDDERQRLEDDNHELKIRLEELEEELDRVVGSRDHERHRQDQSISHFRSELERLRKTSNDELERLREAKETLQRDLTAQRERGSNVEQQMHKLREERSGLQTKNMSLANDLRKIETQQQDVLGTLQSAHEHLSPAGSAPDDLKRLASALEVLAEGAAFHARGLDDQLQLANAQIKANDEKISALETQLVNAETLQAAQQSQLRHKDEEMRKTHHTLETVRAELSSEKAQVEELRAQFAAGETGSDTLKARLAEEERKIEELTCARDSSEVQVEILQQNLKTLRQQIEEMEQAQDRSQSWLAERAQRARELSERLFQHNDRMIRMLENFGYSITKEGTGLLVQRASKVNASQVMSGTETGAPMKRQISGSAPVQHYTDPADTEFLYWTTEDNAAAEAARFDSFMSSLTRLDLDAMVELLTKRYKDVENMAKRYQKDARTHREKTHRLHSEAHDKIAYRAFKEGDLALFLPTRNQATKPWAAFNVGAPHYFLREQDAHRLQSRDWLLARINKVEERVVDLSRSMGNASTKGNAEASDGASMQSIDDNPFELSDGLRWYLIDAVEEKPGAPSTPGLGKSTVAASVVEVKAQMGRKSGGVRDSDRPISGAVNAAKTLHKSLDSRRSSEASRKSGISGMPQLKTSASNTSAAAPLTTAGTDGEAEGTMSPAGPSVRPSEADLRSQGQAREDAKIFDVARDQRLLLKRVPTSEGGDSGSSKQAAAETTGASQKAKGWDKLFSFQYSA